MLPFNLVAMRVPPRRMWSLYFTLSIKTMEQIEWLTFVMVLTNLRVSEHFNRALLLSTDQDMLSAKNLTFAHAQDFVANGKLLLSILTAI